MMWFVLCREDLLRALTRPAVYAAAALLAGLTTASMIQGRSDLDEQRSRYAEELQERVQAQLRTVVPNGRVVDQGLRVLRPPTATTVLLRGTAATLPAGWDLGPSGSEERPPYPPEGIRIESSVSLDFEVVALVFGGLLSVALGLQLVLSNRNSQWTNALKALPVRWREVAIARMVAGAGVVAMMLALWLAVVAVGAGLVEPASAAELRWTLLSLAGPTFLYLTALHAMGMAAALGSRSALRAVVTGMALWLSITFILPQVLAVVSRTLVPRMTRHTMERERRDAHADSVRRFEDAMGRLIGERIPEREMRRLLVNIHEPEIAHLQLDAAWRAGMAAARKVADMFDAEWSAYQSVRRRFQDTSVVLSPASALTVSLSELGSIGDATVRAWERAAMDYHTALAEVVFDDRPMLSSMVPVGSSFASFALIRHPPRTYAVLPVFQEPDISRGAGWQATRRPLMWLLVHTSLALAWAYVAGIRDLRRGTRPQDYGR